MQFVMRGRMSDEFAFLERLERWVVMQAPTGQRFCIVKVQRPGYPKNANRWD